MKVFAAACMRKYGLGAAAMMFPIFALAGTDPVVVKNTASNPVPVTGTVSVNALPPVSGTVTISGTPSVNVTAMPPVSVTTTQDPTYFVVPYALTVTGTDHIRVQLAAPAILDAIATSCNGSLVGTHFQITTDSNALSASAFTPPPAGTQLAVRGSTTGTYTPVAPSLNYPPYQSQALLDYPSLTTDNFNVNYLDQVVLSDVDILGPAFNPLVTYCWGFFLFRKI